MLAEAPQPATAAAASNASAVVASAVVASAAQAATAEGPFYKITGTRLASGKSQEVKAKTGQEGNLTLAWRGTKVGCSTIRFASGAKLLGSTGANYGSGEATLEFSGCFLETGNGAPECEVSKTIKTEPLKLELAYTDETRSGDMAVVFAPVSTKKIFADVAFEGSRCTSDEALFGGSIAGQVEVSNKPVEVGKEPAATKTIQVKLPGTPIRHVWLEGSGTLLKTGTELIEDGGGVEDYATLELELATGATWGVFT